MHRLELGWRHFAQRARYPVRFVATPRGNVRAGGLPLVVAPQADLRSVSVFRRTQLPMGTYSFSVRLVSAAMGPNLFPGTIVQSFC